MIRRGILVLLMVFAIGQAGAQEATYKKYDKAILRALDKVTGRSTDFELRIGQPQIFGSLRVDLQVCFQRPPEEPPESAAFLKISVASAKQVETMAVPRSPTPEELERSGSEEADIRFSGWMFASSPGLNALEHPVYDIWVIACTMSVPVRPGAPG